MAVDTKAWNDLRAHLRSARFDVDLCYKLAREIPASLEAEREIERAREALERASLALKAQDEKIYTGFKKKWRPKHARGG